SCQTQAGQGTGSTLVDPGEIPDELREEWQALERAKAMGGSGEGIDAAADALLELEPPPTLAAGALRAKAERQYLLGNDAEAILLADDALAKLASAGKAAGPPSKALKSQVELLGATQRVL